MKEKLYAIPVNDAFNTECECPICIMYKTLETNAIEYTMGPSYMEDDTRALTDEAGFCQKHMSMINEVSNKLGISLILKTHFDKIIRDIDKLTIEAPTPKGLFKKQSPIASPMISYLENLNCNCFVCNRIDNVFQRYIDTVFYLYKSDKEFKDKFLSSKGFCNEHFLTLLKAAPNHLKDAQLDDFYNKLKELYLENMKRVRDDLSWFIDKFDYRNANEPWKNSKDSIKRAIIKTNAILENTDIPQ